MKNLIATRADNNIKEMTDMTFPIIKKFCSDWGADFMVLDHEPPRMSDDGRPHFRIMKVYELLDKYDRVLSLDCDTVINKTCPNLFDVVPEDCIGTIYEDVGSRATARQSTMNIIQKQFHDIGWNRGYVNTGVFLVSRTHKEIFQSFNGEYFTGWGSDDAHLGLQIKRFGFKVYELDYRFNHMTMFSEAWNGSPDRFDSYIIHYAGRGIFDAESRNEQIRLDIRRIYG